MNIPAPTAGTVERTTARSSFDLRMPACTAPATKPFAAVTAPVAPAVRSTATAIRPAPRERRRPGGLVEAEREVRVLDRLAGGALAEVVDRGDHDPAAGRLVLERGDLGGVGALEPREVGHGVDHLDDVRPGVRGLEQRPRILGRGHVAGADEPAAERDDVRHERDREAEELRDLRRVPVRADRVGRDVLEHGGGVRAVLQRRGRRRRSRTCRRRRRSPGRRSRRSAPARAARRSRSSRGSRSAGRWAAGAPAARTTSPGRSGASRRGRRRRRRRAARSRSRR